MAGTGERDRAFVSYLTLRRSIGCLGVSLPLVLVGGRLLGGAHPLLLQSISAYYDTALRDVLVGTLFAIGFFLFSYRGYDRRDNVAGDLACVFALTVALCPSVSPYSFVRNVHLVAATALFSVLAYFALFLFTKTHPFGNTTSEKRIRNRIYIGCGIAIILCIVSISVVYALGAVHSAVRPVFWLESLALWAFGLSWFVKGKTILTDREPES